MIFNTFSKSNIIYESKGSVITSINVTPKLFVIDRPGGPDDVPSGVCANYLCLLVCI